ncbi:MAG TPA: class I SAM-dependent methyltransferase [Solirubrobacteraceae bacterium]|jgi:SAM-dependent methyltransferase|nr:class I SAM-dependent methyltransferase [Solirubrobacteraceae bacterium]
MDRVLELQTHELEDAHWWYRGRRRIIDELMRGVSLGEGAQILDAGCGSGRNMVDLAKLGTVTGVEISDASVKRARLRDVGEILQCSLTDIPVPSDSFDMAVCLDVIEHIEDEQGALRELLRVIRPGGSLLITVPAYQWLWSNHDVINHHFRRYTSRTLARATTQAGWQTVRVSYFNAGLLPVAIPYRLFARRAHVEGPSSDLQRMPERLNLLLELPLRLEARLIGRGLRIPAGLSLAALFRKPA